MGSGAVGVEFASIFNRFGSDVTIVELLPRLVPIEDEAISAELEKSFRKQGITAYTNAKVTAASASADGVDIDVQLGDGQSKQIRADYLLVATGRGPVTTGLNAEGIGLELEKGYVKVDPLYRTGVPGISAIGDVITLGTPGHPQLAHAECRVILHFAFCILHSAFCILLKQHRVIQRHLFHHTERRNDYFGDSARS